MSNAFIAIALAAASPNGGDGRDAAASLDLRCFSLMAQLSEDEDPRLRSLGRVAAQYFLGRIDAAAPGLDVEQAAAVAPARSDPALLSQCSDVMRAGGRDFRAIGEALAPRATPSA